MEDECVGWADTAPDFVSAEVASDYAEHSGQCEFYFKKKKIVVPS
jgi:hypothetical protein